jgi:hypothetical protein
MLLFSYLYKEFNLFDSPGFLASFHAVRCALFVLALRTPRLPNTRPGCPPLTLLPRAPARARPCVPAMCVRAVLKISEHALVDHSSGSPDISSILLFLAVRRGHAPRTRSRRLRRMHGLRGLTTRLTRTRVPPRRRWACC